MTTEGKIKQLDITKKKIKLLSDSIVAEMIRESRDISIMEYSRMLQNRFSYWQKELGQEEIQKWKQLDLEEAIKNELDEK